VTSGQARYQDLFAIGEFRALFGAHLISMLGDVIAAVVLTVLVFQRTGSAALAASVFALSFVPYLFGGSLAGAVADRLPSRRVLVSCDLASAALVTVMTIPGLPVAALLVLLFTVSLIAPIFQGVRAATLPDILPAGPPYVLGRSLIRMVAQATQVAGYAVGGLLLTSASPRQALAADAASFAASAALLRFGTLHRPARTGASRPLARDSLAGIRAVLTHPGLGRILWFSWLVPACAVAPEALATPYVTHIGEPAYTAGYFLCGLPAGTILADLIVGRWLTSRTQRRLVVPAAVLVFASLASFAARPDLPVAIGLLGLSGLGFAYTPGVDGLLIETAPDALRNRALATSGAGLMFTQGIGFALWGLAGQFVAPTVVIPVSAAAGLATVRALKPPTALRP
jgi:MFS family permease